MPKVHSRTSPRPSSTYNSFLHVPLHHSQINAIYAFLETKPGWNGNDTKDIYDTDQVALWLNEAFLRANGHSTIQRPKTDPFATRGRTIYDTQPINFDTPLPQPQLSPVRRLSEVIDNLDELISKTPYLPLEKVPEPVTPPRRKAEPQPKHYRHYRQRTPIPELCLGDTKSSPSLSHCRRRGPDLQALFLAITKGTARAASEMPESIIPTPTLLQKAEDISESPERQASMSSSSEDYSMDEGFEGQSWSRSSTPSISWSVSSASSSPESDRTIDWNELEECSGPAIISIEPINFQPEGCDAAVYARLERLSYGKIAGAESSDDSFDNLFELFVNTEECH